jgi:hypothetical protein
MHVTHESDHFTGDPVGLLNDKVPNTLFSLLATDNRLNWKTYIWSSNSFLNTSITKKLPYGPHKLALRFGIYLQKDRKELLE